MSRVLHDREVVEQSYLRPENQAVLFESTWRRVRSDAQARGAVWVDRGVIAREQDIGHAA